MTDLLASMSLPAAARRLGVAEKTLRGLVQAGVVPFYMVGRTYRFREVALAAWIETQERAAQAPRRHAID